MSAALLAFKSPATEADPGPSTETWDNEGGRQARDSAPMAKRDRLQSAENDLTKDFIEGRIGIRHNTYAHRLRCLRQDRAQLHASALGDNGPASLGPSS